MERERHVLIHYVEHSSICEVGFQSGNYLGAQNMNVYYHCA